MKKIHLYPSHPDYKKFNSIQFELLIATNPQMFFDIDFDVPETERLALVELIKENIKKTMEEYQFLPANLAEIINKLEDEIQTKK